MTEIGTITPLGHGELLATESASSSRSYFRQIVDSVLRRVGAILGAIWIGTLVLLAVFSPLIANSHPCLMEKDGHWSSPMLAHLSAGDVILQTLFWSGAVLYFIPKPRRQTRLILWICVSVLAIGIFPFGAAADVASFRSIRQ